MTDNSEVAMTNGALLIPYGVERWSASYLGAAGQRGVPECRVPHVVIEPERRQPLRLYDGGYDFMEVPPLQDLADPATQLEYLEGYCDRHCSLWGRAQKLFVERYFAFVSDEIERNRRALEDRAAEFDGLYAYRDWLFSALRPLPQAQLCISADGPPPVRVDCAFWTGEALLAVDLMGSDTPGSAQRKRAARLVDVGVTHVELPHAVLRAGNLSDHLPPALLRFWESDRVPSGPFIPGSLSAAGFGGS